MMEIDTGYSTHVFVTPSEMWLVEEVVIVFVGVVCFIVCSCAFFLCMLFSMYQRVRTVLVFDEVQPEDLNV